jgi:hypothetical protein
MQVLGLPQRQARLQGLQALAADPARCRAHLRQTSMLDGLDKARALASAFDAATVIADGAVNPVV